MIKRKIFIIGILTLGALSLQGIAFAATQGQQEGTLPPPLITIYNEDISNDEIFYIGGTTVAPRGEITIYMQGDKGSILSFMTEADEKGNWFYSHPQFLDRGRYIVWSSVRHDEYVSPPSPQISLEVIPQALQLGEWRLSYELFFGLTSLILLTILIILIIVTAYHYRHHSL